MSTMLNLTAQQRPSRVLGAWLAGRPDGAQRAGVQPAVQGLGENAVTTNLNYTELLNVLGVAATSAAGVAVTPQSATRVSAVYACVARICGAISTLPLDIFERVGGSRSQIEHDYHWMLNERANEDMSSADAWTYLLSSKFFYGDGYAELMRPGVASSRVIGWMPHHPLRVTPFRENKTQRKYFRIQPEIGPAYVRDQADMVQLTSLGYDGLTSPSAITYAAREAIGTALAGQNFAGKFFSEGAAFDYALQTDHDLKAPQLEALRASLMARVQGSRAPLILTGGLKPAQLTINPKDAEILATRLFSVEEICRILGVPPHLVGHTEKASSWGTGMEAQGANFVRYTLRTHLVQIAQEFNHKLWPLRSRYFIEHDVAALQKGDMKSRFEAYRIALGRAGEQPFLSADEIRHAENMPPADLPPNPSSSTAVPGDPAEPIEPNDPAEPGEPTGPNDPTEPTDPGST